MEDRFVCVACGSPAPRVFDEYGPDCVRGATCRACQHVVDPYVEVDAVIVVLNFLLFKPEVFRHCCNIASRKDFLDKRGIFKLFLLARLSEAYVSWSCYGFGSVLETFVVTLAEVCVFLCTVVALMMLPPLILSSAAKQPAPHATLINIHALLSSLLFSTCYPLMLLPLVACGHAHVACYLLMHALVALSAVVALATSQRCGPALPLVAVGCAVAARFALQHVLAPGAAAFLLG